MDPFHEISPQEDKIDVEELELFITRFKVSTQVPDELV